MLLFHTKLTSAEYQNYLEISISNNLWKVAFSIKCTFKKFTQCSETSLGEPNPKPLNIFSNSITNLMGDVVKVLLYPQDCLDVSYETPELSCRKCRKGHARQKALPRDQSESMWHLIYSSHRKLVTTWVWFFFRLKLICFAKMSAFSVGIYGFFPRKL